MDTSGTESPDRKSGTEWKPRIIPCCIESAIDEPQQLYTMLAG